ncbi:unnamed protein product [Brachionus calyciflorus]|uniref:Uncharacterized protein n=1 Tax=Brachionus calyciflorus TaxID=104777 RepID=A0A814PIV0_9BILA|nr:unnamed protein product [Brachionus calyciflorus]
MKVGDLVKIQKTNGEFCRARVTSIDSSDATVMFIKMVLRFSIKLAAFLSGLFSNYQEQKELNEECISSKNGYVSSIFGSQKCELHSVWKAFFKTFVDICKFVADSFGTFINSFVSPLFANWDFLAISN